MKILRISTEQHFYRHVSGEIWVEGNEDYSFWKRYLKVFDKVEVIGRTKEVDYVNPIWKIAVGNNVEIIELPEYKAFDGLFKASLKIPKLLYEYTKPKGITYILRVPGFISLFTYYALKMNKQKFGLEIVTDPESAFQSAAFGSNLVGFLRSFLIKTLRKQCKEASATAYVTADKLQKKYPPANNKSFNYSSIDIGDEAFSRFENVLARFKKQPELLPNPQIITIGRLHRPFKGIDIALRSIKILKEEGYSINYKVIGGGILVETYLQQAKDLGIEKQVEFLGEIKGSHQIFNILENADLFVLPSRREGLPRVIIEAMAIGLPALGTPIGGIPELLDNEFIFPLDDYHCLAEKIKRFCDNKTLRLKASNENFTKSNFYRRERLIPRRTSFYEAVLNNS